MQVCPSGNTHNSKKWKPIKRPVKGEQLKKGGVQSKETAIVIQTSYLGLYKKVFRI